MVPLSIALVEAAAGDEAHTAVGVARLLASELFRLASELFREDKASLGRAAELCQTPIEDFIEFAAARDVPLHYGTEQFGEHRVTILQLLS